MATIRLERVTKRFAAVRAVDGVELTIEDGEFFALLGPSGCGKTTTLRLIAGLEQPTEGRIHIGGRDVTHLPAHQRDVAMVFQDYALFPHMSVFDNIAYPLKVRRAPRTLVEQRVAEAARHLQIEGLLGRRPGQLSGGQQQRTAVARAVVHRPKAFLFDEPLSNLDAKLRVEARGFLKHLQKQFGITAVYVTHDQAEAMALADRIAVMEAGKVRQVGTPREIYEWPLNTFVASFVGNPPMNLIPCRLEVQQGRPWMAGRTFRLSAAELLANLHHPPQHGESLYLGVRPENLRLLGPQAAGLQGPPGPAAPEAGRLLAARLFVVEWLGHETLTTVEVDGTRVVIRNPQAAETALSELVWVEVDFARARLYRASGELIR